MAKNQRKRQQKLERRSAKRKEKKHELVRAQSVSFAERMAAADRYPIVDALVTNDFWTQGMGWVLLSRSLPDGSIALAIFLVDRYCLGVKDALVDVTNRAVYEGKYLQRMHRQFTSRALSPAAVRKLVEAAVTYARDLGLPPHPDYQKAKHIFGSINPNEATEEFEFGKDGKPFFINGPSDTPARCRQIAETLERSCGPGGYLFLLRSPPDDLGELEEDYLEGPEDFDEDEE